MSLGDWAGSTSNRTAPGQMPADVLLGPQAGRVQLPVCDHYSGVAARMRKSLALQVELAQEFGACVFDATLDCEDGAPVGGEAEHAQLVCELALAQQRSAPGLRVGVRVHAVDHPSFACDVALIVGGAASAISHVMLPKVETLDEVQRAVHAIDQAAAGAATLPLHVLIESPAAVHRAFELAAHPRVQSLSFGLMDFVSAHAGAIPASALRVEGQFEHPLVRRAKLEIASAAHAHGKVPSHGVVTEFRDRAVLAQAAQRAAQELGYTRMWSIHPDQIRPIVEAFAPDAASVHAAIEVIERALQHDWAPIDIAGQLHDRASYRYHWQVLERARQTGRVLPQEILHWWPASQPVSFTSSGPDSQDVHIPTHNR